MDLINIFGLPYYLKTIFAILLLNPLNKKTPKINKILRAKFH